MDDYLSKPIDKAQLQNTLNRWLNDPGESSSEEKVAG
jgi:YesN/AraC family two-component response regulator